MMMIIFIFTDRQSFVQITNRLYRADTEPIQPTLFHSFRDVSMMEISTDLKNSRSGQKKKKKRKNDRQQI